VSDPSCSVRVTLRLPCSQLQSVLKHGLVLVGHLGLTEYDLVGHSLGGRIVAGQLTAGSRLARRLALSVS
jgi:hypothetical protein